jgi:hypothetical protein
MSMEPAGSRQMPQVGARNADNVSRTSSARASAASASVTMCTQPSSATKPKDPVGSRQMPRVGESLSSDTTPPATSAVSIMISGLHYGPVFFPQFARPHELSVGNPKCKYWTWRRAVAGEKEIKIAIF